MRSCDAGHVLHPGGVFGDRQPPGPQREVGVVQGGGPKPFGVAQPVADHPELAPSGDRRVLLTQRSRGAVAGVGERRLAVLDQRGVERFEVGEPEEHLTAHLEDVRYRIVVAGRQPFGDVVDGAGVQRDVLAGAAVAAGRRPDQPPVAIHQRQGDAVDLELTQVWHVVTDLGADAGRPHIELFGAEHVVQAEHPLQMLGRSEIGGEAGTADELGRRIGRAQFRILLLESLRADAAAGRTPRRK